MKRLPVIVVLLCLSLIVIQAQNPGDKATAGFTYNRANLNPDTGNFKPPFKLEATADLPVIQDAQTLYLFDDYLLVGENGDPGNYTLIQEDPYAEVWTKPALVQTSGRVYEPAYANNIVLLASGTTQQAALRAYQVSTGNMLWEDTTSTVWDSRTPLIMQEMAFYHSASRVKAVKATTGVAVWTQEVSTAAAPLAAFGDQLYLAKANSVIALDLRSGSILWETNGIGGDGCRILPTARNVFVANPDTGVVSALDSYTGAEAWSNGYPDLAASPIAAAYGNLYVFYSDGDYPSVAALNPATGAAIWSVQDPADSGGLPEYGQVTNNNVYFYNSGSERIRILNAFNGNVIWSMHSAGVRDLVMNDQYLIGLRAAQLDIYSPKNVVYLSHVAEGTDPINQSIAISTMFVLNNAETADANATFKMYKSNGTAMEVNVADLEGGAPCPTCDPETATSEFQLTVDAGQSVAFATTGENPNLVTGWAEVTSDVPLSATSVFRTTESGTILFEAGVGSTGVTGKAQLFITGNDYESVGGLYNTGVFMVNPMDEDAVIDVTFTSADGSTDLTTTVNLAAGTHTAKFVNTADGLFPTLSGFNVTGTLTLTSDIPFAAGGLRTQNGYQMSSYPIGMPVK